MLWPVKRLRKNLNLYLERFIHRGGSRLAGRGVSVSRSHMSFYLRTGGGGGDGETCKALPESME